MKQSKVLEIFLITYNREKHLKKTLDFIFNKTSPIQNYPIKILDNHSTDGTEQLCKKYMKNHPNLQYIRNNRNIGIGGNICRAIELSSLKYFWILCDNDDLDFSAWSEVEYAMEKDYDVIYLRSEKGEKGDITNPEDFMFLSYLLPSSIYKTSLITDNLMCYCMSDIYTACPHVAMVGELINQNSTFFMVNKSIVLWQPNPIDDWDDYSFDRSVGKNIHPKNRTKYCYHNMFSACSMIEDVKKRAKAINSFWGITLNDEHLSQNLSRLSFLEKIDLFFLLKGNRKHFWHALFMKLFSYKETEKKITIRFLGIKIHVKKWRQNESK